ncbi:hypothetical protein B0H14DRAFT_3516918 [Mycena olivaceomarginata]|nr:hypothetical protein B0H14DRAFT_3516918 [Mycena olivaceomarginata]
MAGCLPVDRHITVHLSSFFLVPSKSLHALDFFGRAIQTDINIDMPPTGQQKLIDINDERCYPVFYDKKITQGSPHRHPRISNGRATSSASPVATNEQGFPMKQGVLLPYRVKLLLSDSHSCYHPPPHRRAQAQDEGEIVGLTDDVLPKRVNKIQRPLQPEQGGRRGGRSPGKKEGAKPCTKVPKIQRLRSPPSTSSAPVTSSRSSAGETEHQKEQKAEFEMNLAPGNIFLSPTMWSDEIFIDALSDALIQRTRPALYDQLDVVTTVTDQRLKAESTAAIREWASGHEFKVSVSDSDANRLQQGHAPPSCAELRDMCTKVIAETAVVCEQRDALVAENSALIAENSALKAENLKMKIQKALHEKAIMDTKCTEEGEESSPDREPVQDFEACIFPVLTQLVSDAQPTLRHAGTLRTDDGPCKTCTGESKHHVGY